MSGERSRKTAANNRARIIYNGTGSHVVSNKSVEKEKNYSNTYGDQVGGAYGEEHRKRKKMKELWVILLLLALGGILYYFFGGNSAEPQVATEVTTVVDSTKVESEPARKIECAPNGEPILEMPEFPEDGNLTPEWLEKKKQWDEQQLRIMEWKEQHGPSSVYIEYGELPYEVILALNNNTDRYSSRLVYL